MTNRELKQIRRELELAIGDSDKQKIIFVSLVLPENCTIRTLDFAHSMIRQLKKVNCNARISELLFAKRNIANDRAYEIMPTIPLSEPCIRIYQQREGTEPGWFNQAVRGIKKWLSMLTPFSSATLPQRSQTKYAE